MDIIKKLEDRVGKKRIGIFQSQKMQSPIAWESYLERDYIYLLEFDQNVLSFKEQRLKIYADVDGTKRTYTPDFFVERTDQFNIVEVKPQKRVQTMPAQIQIAIGTAFCEQMKMKISSKPIKYVVVTEDDIRKGYLLENILMLHGYLRMQVSFDIHHRTVQILNNRVSTSIRELSLELNKYNVINSLAVVYHLISTGFLLVDLNNIIGPETMIEGVK